MIRIRALHFLFLTMTGMGNLFGNMTWETAHAQLQSMERHAYPYAEWIDQLEQSGHNSISLFAYGSLMDKNSAARTINADSLQTMTLGLAFGVKRIFDLDVPIRETSKWPKPLDSNARGMLNLQSSDSHHFVNGVIFEVSLMDLRALMKREEGYDLMPLVVANWDNVQTSKETYRLAYAFHAPQESKYTSTTVFPRPRYYELTRDAAKNVSPLYGHLWLLTTFMADGRPIMTWEKAVEAQALQTQIICPNCS